MSIKQALALVAQHARILENSLSQKLSEPAEVHVLDCQDSLQIRIRVVIGEWKLEDQLVWIPGRYAEELAPEFAAIETAVLGEYEKPAKKIAVLHISYAGEEQAALN